MNEEFDRLDPANLLTALVDVYQEFGMHKKEPGSEHWEWDTKYRRPEMVSAVTSRFCDLYECHPSEFPYRDDYVAWLWVRYRKMKPESKKKLLERLQVEPAPGLFD